MVVAVVLCVWDICVVWVLICMAAPDSEKFSFFRAKTQETHSEKFFCFSVFRFVRINSREHKTHILESFCVFQFFGLWYMSTKLQSTCFQYFSLKYISVKQLFSCLGFHGPIP